MSFEQDLKEAFNTVKPPSVEDTARAEYDGSLSGAISDAIVGIEEIRPREFRVRINVNESENDFYSDDFLQSHDDALAAVVTEQLEDVFGDNIDIDGFERVTGRLLFTTKLDTN
jgi:hypothetical protein